MSSQSCVNCSTYFVGMLNFISKAMFPERGVIENSSHCFLFWEMAPGIGTLFPLIFQAQAHPTLPYDSQKTQG